MQDEQKPQEMAPETSNERMFFEQPATIKNNGGGKKTFIPIVLLLLIAGAVGAWFFMNGNKNSASVESPTPEAINFQTEQPSPSPSIDRSKVKIEVLNGTGISGEASFLQNQLKDMGYTNVNTGNSTKQDSTKTQVSFASQVDPQIKDEIESKLKDLYKDVEVTTLTQNNLDVRIITGLRKGSTPKPTATATPKPTSSASPTASTSPTPTPTSTPQ